MKQKLSTAFALIALLALPVALTGCGGSSDAKAADGDKSKSAAQQASQKSDDGKKKGDDEDEKKEEAVPVEVLALDRGPIESVLQFSTNLEAENQVKVFSQAKRLVTELLVEEGDTVSEGQLLVRLQDDEQRSMVAKAENELAKAEREFKRQERLFKQELISEQEYNDATYDIEQLRISLNDARRELTYTEVRAPISGTVTARMVNLGDQLQINQHLFDMVDFDSIVARIFVPERHLDQLRRGLVARLKSQATGERSFAGNVQRIAPVVDPKSGTVKVTVEVGGQPGLRPGMYVDVDLVVATNMDAVLVPKRALVYDNDQVFVFRIDGEDDARRVERVFLEPRLTNKNFIEPAAGLDAGDRVVIAGQAGLKDGALVKLPGDKAPESTDEGDDTAQAQAADRASL